MDATNEHRCFRMQTESTGAGYLWKCLSTIDNAYNEISKWRENTFLVQYGKVGREFIDEMTEHVNDWNNGSKMQPIALKSATVLLAVGLHTLSQKSTAKDHQECLAKRLVPWKRVKSTNCCANDGFLSNSQRVDPPYAPKIISLDRQEVYA